MLSSQSVNVNQIVPIYIVSNKAMKLNEKHIRQWQTRYDKRSVFGPNSPRCAVCCVIVWPGGFIACCRRVICCDVEMLYSQSVIVNQIVLIYVVSNKAMKIYEKHTRPDTTNNVYLPKLSSSSCLLCDLCPWPGGVLLTLSCVWDQIIPKNIYIGRSQVSQIQID